MELKEEFMSEEVLGVIEIAVYLGAIIYWNIEHEKGVAKYKREEKMAKDEIKRRSDSIQELSRRQMTILSPSTKSNVVQYYNDYFSITLSNKDKKIILNDGIKSYSYSYDNLMNIELIIDENTTSSPSLNGAIVGGLLFGGVGAIIGSSNRVYDKRLKKIVLRINVDDINTPIHELIFLSLPVPLSPDSPEIKKELVHVNDWYGRLTTIIEKKKESKSNAGSLSIADEIIKLKKLLDAGIITNDEFETSKRKLF